MYTQFATVAMYRRVWHWGLHRWLLMPVGVSPGWANVHTYGFGLCMCDGYREVVCAHVEYDRDVDAGGGLVLKCVCVCVPLVCVWLRMHVCVLLFCLISKQLR